jgi:hypothetical protein
MPNVAFRALEAIEMGIVRRIQGTQHAVERPVFQHQNDDVFDIHPACPHRIQQFVTAPAKTCYQ